MHVNLELKSASIYFLVLMLTPRRDKVLKFSTNYFNASLYCLTVYCSVTGFSVEIQFHTEKYICTLQSHDCWFFEVKILFS